ncbi:hypothetical protein ACIGXM_14165 [Kitasatospora sp. NPDC052896]|uniref:hypothetical protein n=1 Tax=Kitasatospora sp. NPDC052896 TaxID=3364061 RepID=UPI0037CC0ABE
MTRPNLEQSRFYWERLHAIKRASGQTWNQLAAGVGREPGSLRPWVTASKLARNARRGGSLPHHIVIRLAASLGLSASALYTFLPEPPLSAASAGFTLFTHCERCDPELADEVFRVIAATFPEVVRRVVPEWGRD